MNGLDHHLLIAANMTVISSEQMVQGTKENHAIAVLGTPKHTNQHPNSECYQRPERGRRAFKQDQELINLGMKKMISHS